MNGLSAFTWFARHELRLAWREAMGTVQSGPKRAIAIAFLAVGGLHLAALFAVPRDLDRIPEKAGLLLVTGVALSSWMLMLSQAMESVTRILYARGDTELVLSSPAPAGALFAARLAGIALLASALAWLLMAPFVNVLAYRGGTGWLAAHAVVLAMGASAASCATVLTLLLFRLVGPARTRLIAQVVAAILGAAIVIGLQVGAILAHRDASRLAFLRDEAVIAGAPDPGSILWWLARAAMGEIGPLIAVVVAALASSILVVALCARNFADHVVATAGARDGRGPRGKGRASFRTSTAASVLRAKELRLLVRDPWLLSRILMQLLYLVPPALLLWQGFGEGTDRAALVAPILVMAAGQMAGGLAWLAITGEEAPELIATAPVTSARVIRAKIESVLLGVAVPMAPLIALLALLAPFAALITAIATLFAAASATAIQSFFRGSAKRRQFRLRSESRIATTAEAFSSIAWAGAGGLAAAGSPLAIIPVLLGCCVILVAHWLAPARAQ